jgi:membrane-bound serine protease (ClpP class)
MRSTAEAKNRNPRIAEAMVDANIEIEGISEKGQVITFTASEAMKNGFCEGIASSKEEVLKLIGITDYELLPYQLSTIEEIISLFLNPLVSSLLILIMIGGIYFELQTPGVGFPIIAAITAALLYFTPYYLNGLAEYWEILVFIVGIGLIMVEIFVLPGFGIAGISGIILVIGSLVLVMVENDAFDFTLVDMGNLKQAIVATLGGTLGAVAVIFWGISRVGNSGLFKKVALQDTLQKEAGYTSSFLRNDLIGLTGTAHTILRPSGKVNIDDQIYDAYTRGEYIEKGEEIVVISDEGTSLKVKKVKDGL